MEVDLKSIYEIQEATTQELRNIDRAIRRFAEQAAAYERQNHYYKNRTGNLERSTKAHVTKTGDTIEASLVMGMYYASFVVGRGFSQIDVAEKMMESNIESYLSRIDFII